MTKRTKSTLLLAAFVVSQGASQAAITVTNLGTTTPTGFATGNTALDLHATIVGLPEVYGFRIGTTHNQTFTIGSAITLGKIYVGYGTLTGAATATLITITVDAGNDASNEITESFTLTPSSITQQSAAPYSGINWLELDVSSSNLALAAGQHAFKLVATSVTGAANTWLFAPSYTGSISTPNAFTTNYAGGALTVSGVGSGTAIDSNFAISAIPEPGSLALLSLGVLPLLRRRRV